MPDTPAHCCGADIFTVPVLGGPAAISHNLIDNYRAGHQKTRIYRRSISRQRLHSRTLLAQSLSRPVENRITGLFAAPANQCFQFTVMLVHDYHCCLKGLGNRHLIQHKRMRTVQQFRLYAFHKRVNLVLAMHCCLAFIMRLVAVFIRVRCILHRNQVRHVQRTVTGREQAVILH